MQRKQRAATATPNERDVVDHDVVNDAVRALMDGGLVGLPTETVYGLAALASDPLAVRRVFATKGRPVDHPLIVHIASHGSLDAWAIDIPEYARVLAAMCWPGPLTLVLHRAAHVLDEVTGGRDTVALRVPAHPIAAAVLASLPLHSGIAAPSANRFGSVSPTTADHVRADLGDRLIEGDVIIDGGPCRVGVESTILDCTANVPTILRPGGMPVEQIDEVIGHRVERNATGPVRAPGMLASHYAPRAGVLLVDEADAKAGALRALVDERVGDGQRVGVLAPSDITTPSTTYRLDAPDPYVGEGLAPILYARLREADVAGLDLLIVVTPDASDALSWAVVDRLTRASTRSV